MKWTKFDPENPPNHGYTYWEINEGNGVRYWSASYSAGYLEVHKYFGYSAKQLVEYNAHWIYPQDLEMPE